MTLSVQALDGVETHGLKPLSQKLMIRELDTTLLMANGKYQKISGEITQMPVQTPLLLKLKRRTRIKFGEMNQE
jgi:hypothetical protein